MARKLRYRSIWISDVHLGTRGCQAEMLLDFLRRTESDHLYLVGDIVDGWRLRRRGYWDASHHEVIQALLGKALSGTRVIYIPGNHDELMRGYLNKIGREHAELQSLMRTSYAVYCFQQTHHQNTN